MIILPKSGQFSRLLGEEADLHFAPQYNQRTVKTTLNHVEDSIVKLTIEVDEDELQKAINSAFVRIGKEVRIPGFRPGKVPRKVLESHLGPEVGRSEALREAVPEYYDEAVRDNEVDAIAPPELDITEGREEGPLVIEAVVEVRPEIELEGYDSISVEVDSPVASEDEIDEQIDNLRTQFADLVDVERPAEDGDHILMDIAGSVDGEALPGLTADDYSYEVGLEALVAELDENLRGASAGDELEFGADHPSEDDTTIDFRVSVQAVRAKDLPELNDEWASENSEFDTLEELKGDVAERISTMRRARAISQFREGVATELGKLVDLEPPEALVNGTMQETMQNLMMSLQAQGMSIDMWMEMQGKDPENFTEELQQAANSSVLVDLALRAVAKAEGLEVSAEDIDAELEETANRLGEKVTTIRGRLETFDGLMGVRSELLKRKALDLLIEKAEALDESDGSVIDKTLLDPPEESSTEEIDA